MADNQVENTEQVPTTASIPDSIISNAQYEQNVKDTGGLTPYQRFFHKQVADYAKSSVDGYTSYDAATGAPVQQQSLEDFTKSVLSGGYVPEDKDYSIKTPDGRIGKVSGKDLKQVLESGAGQLESREEQHNREVEEKYGDKDIAAFGAAFARGSTLLPISDIVGGAAGYGAELKGLEEANPITSFIGEASGFLAGTLVGSTEAGAAAKAAYIVGQAGLTRASEKAAESIAAQLAKRGIADATSKSFARRLLYKSAPAIAEGAIQGAAQGVSRLFTEEAFGDVDLTAENLVSYAGFGALFGGTLGSAIGITKAVAPLAKDAIVKTSEKALSSLTDKESAFMKMFNTSPARMQKELNLNKNFMEEGIEQAQKAFTGKKITSAEEVADAIHEHLGSTWEKLDKIGKSVDDKLAKEGTEKYSVMLTNKDTLLDGVQEEMMKLADKAKEAGAMDRAAQYLKKVEEIKSMRGESIPFEKLRSNVSGIADSITEKAGDFVTDYDKNLLRDVALKSNNAEELKAGLKEFVSRRPELAEGAFKPAIDAINKEIESKPAMKFLNFNELQELKKSQYDYIKSYGKTPGQYPIEEAFHELYRKAAANAQSSYANIIERGLGEELKGLNRSYHITKKLDDLAGREALRDTKAGMTIGLGGELAGGLAASGHVGFVSIHTIKKMFDSVRFRKAVLMGSFENATKFTESAIGKFIKDIGKAAETVGEASTPVTVRRLTDYSIAKDYSNGSPKRAENESAAYENIRRNAQEALDNPEAALERVRKQTRLISEDAPGTSAAIEAQYLRTLQFLGTKLNNKSHKTPGVFDVMKQQTKSAAELAKVGRYLQAIESPTDMLKLAKSGRLSKEHADALQAVYPKMFQQIQQAALAEINKPGKNYTYQQKLQLGLLLNVSSVESMAPQNIQSLQMSFAGISEQPQIPGTTMQKPNPHAKFENKTDNTRTATGRIENPER